MERIVCVRLRDTGQSFHYNAGDISLKEGDYVIVEHDRGLDYGQVVCLGAENRPAQAMEPKDKEPREKDTEDFDPKDKDSKEPKEKQLVKKIVRLAKEGDLKQIEENRVKSKEAFNTCSKKIAEHKLEMKLVQAEYSFDRSKIVFYFTSGGRVDFRELVKDLAKIFKARIELRQIGVRDETKFFGGYGPCGRELCCSKFLTDFVPVTIKMAKEQGLPLNPPKISGICGRLMCCLSYECGIYKQFSKGLPREGEKITVKDVKGKVIGVNVFKRTATVELETGVITEVKYK
jgi:cell fate regulator YaaT (PSP1 superfamily)